MCGICGWVAPNSSPAPGTTELMADLLFHRGPDDSGVEHGPGWGLGFRRLSILDLSPLGHQPMLSRDGRFWLVFNGEIYNYVELRSELQRNGERFESGSDTEVLLRLLAQRGVAALSLLNGMFALALIDLRERRFLLARDRLGVKPLYYEMRNGSLRFASELKALLAFPDASRDIDPVAVTQYLIQGYLASETCIFRNMKKLPPAHFLAGDLDAPQDAQLSKYWELNLNGESSGKEMTASEFDDMHNLLRDSVRIRMRSDVPLGVFLSGGIDSGLVAALAKEASPTPPLALTIAFSEGECDERALAQSTAEHIGLEHRIVMQPPPQLSDVDRMAWFFDEPFGDPSALPTLALCEAASHHATVFLSGDGGDEAFAGYRRYIETTRAKPMLNFGSAASQLIRALARFFPEFSPMRYKMEKVSMPHMGAAMAFDEVPSDPVILRILHPDLLPLVPMASDALWSRWRRSLGASLTSRQQSLDYDLYLPGDILVKVDRASMANSIEVRSPFLDYRLVEWVARLPRSTLLNASGGKRPLRALAKHYLPENVKTAKKRGFDVPLGHWFREQKGVTMLRDRLLASQSSHAQWSDPSVVARVIDDHASGRGRDFGLLLWRLLVLESWARHYTNLTPQRRPPASPKPVQAAVETARK
jgi:asparagine synthase (glutamine-hydrolysing)